MRLWLVVLLALSAPTFAADDSCLGRCEYGFDADKMCQCDSMCKYYKSCCSDFEATCHKNTRGDTFAFAEDDDDNEDLFNVTMPAPQPSGSDSSFSTITYDPEPTKSPILDFGPRRQKFPEITKSPREMEPSQRVPVTQIIPVLQTASSVQKVPSIPVADVTQATPETTTALSTATTGAPDPDAEVCSGRPFDSFMQLKNGSIYAFRGKYFFELDQKSVFPGYPKLIEDVWGISGPIDAAFTRINCQGKTYIFKGNKYWRFDNGVLDANYPRNISVGFENIPNHVDAAFAVPAHSHHGKEKVYFFKGDQYYTYEFLYQPSHAECVTMSERSPSTLFRRYTDMYFSNFETFFRELFSDKPQHRASHDFIDGDWKGITAPVDAAMAGRIYITPWRTTLRRNDYRPDQQWDQRQGQQSHQQYQQYGQQWNQQYGQQGDRRRQNRSPVWETMAERGINMGQAMAEKGREIGLRMEEKRMEMEERFGREWNRRWDHDWDWNRGNGYRQYNRGNYDSRDNHRNGRGYWEFIRRSRPIQSVYFFKGDKYYRMDLRTKRVDRTFPRYPRSIAKYWLGCSDITGAEK
ncbi:vitronectin a [Thalassophryne amazonica]|uniref:vitronectin a n=1 Tax=Thalassophryne amazonica TaxID=390379 RepID=UPI0014712B58|nr:vitronectin a [Thalassophryne amazonica]